MDITCANAVVVATGGEEFWLDDSRKLTGCILRDTVLRVTEVRKTEIFSLWIDGLRDIRARARVLARVERLIAGNPGDTKPVGEGVSELRIDYGPGYRVYYKRRGRDLVILLAGGDKKRQKKDVQNALRIAGSLLE